MTNFRHRIKGPGSAGDIWVCTIFSTSSASLAEAHAAWTTFCDSFFGSTMVGLWAKGTSANQLETDELDPTTGHNVAQQLGTVSYVGTNTGQQPDPRGSIVVGFRTALPTRAGRGRIYVPLCSTDGLDTDGTLLPATIDPISTQAADGLRTMSGTTTPVIYHKVTAKNPTISTTPIIAVYVSQVVGSQRRRTNKVPPDYAITSF